MSQGVNLDELRESGQSFAPVENPNKRLTREGKVEIGPIEAAGIAFEEFNVIGKAREEIREQDFEPTPNFDPFATETFKQNPDAAPLLSGADSEAEQQAMLERREHDREELRRLNNSDYATIAKLGADLLNPSNAAPLAGSVFRMGTKWAIAETFAAAAAEQSYLAANSQAVDYTEAAANTALITGAGSMFGRMAADDPARQALNISDAQRVRVGEDAGVIRRADDSDPEPSPVKPEPEASEAVFESVQATRRQRERETGTATYDTTEGAHGESVGAAAVSGAEQEALRKAARDDLGLVETGTKIEQLGTNPRFRLLASGNTAARSAAADLAPMSGLLQNRNLRGVPTPQSATTEFKRRYLAKMGQIERSVREQFLQHRGIQAKQSDLGISAQVTRENVLSLGRRRGSEIRSEAQFNEAVGKALRRGDEDPLNRPEVTAAARAIRPLLDQLGHDAASVGLFDDLLNPEIIKRKKQIEELQEKQKELETQEEIRETQTEINRLEREAEAIQRRLDDIRQNGPSQNTAETFFPRVARRDKIDAEPERFRDIIRDHLRREGMDEGELEAAVEETVQNFRGSTNQAEVEGPSAGLPRSLHERADIPDEVIEDFLENDAVAVLRMHTQNLGNDVLLKERFGSVSLNDQLQRIANEGEARAASASSEAEAERIRRETARDQRDVRELRDRVRGTAGQSGDPMSVVQRGARLARAANTITMSGSFGIANLGESANVVLQNGLKESLGAIYANTLDEQAATVRQMTSEMRDRVGLSAQITTGLTAAQFAEADIFGRGSRLERATQSLAQNVFQLSGAGVMTHANQQLAATTTMFRMNEALRQMRAGTITQADRARLANSGINERLAGVMNEKLDQYATQVKGFEISNTADWPGPDGDDAAGVEAARVYDRAVQDEVNRTVIQPDAGDRATWTTRPLGRVIAQFQSFNQAAQSKILAAGLQRRDRALLEGMAALTATGMLVHEIKRVQHGETRKEPLSAKLMHGIENSGLGGVITTGHTAFERISGNRGLSQVFTNQPPEDLGGVETAQDVVATAGGPTGSQITALSDLISTLANEGPSLNAFQQMRRFLPLQNNPAVDPALDTAFEQ